MKPDIDVNAGHVPPPGHVAALYQDELYDVAAGRAGVARPQSFGVIFGHQRVVVYIEPDGKARVESNTARTALLMNGDPLPWSEWAAEFRDHLPKQIEALVEAQIRRSIDPNSRRVMWLSVSRSQ